MNKISAFVCALGLFGAITNVHAEEIDTNTAQMQAMDKITGRVSVINVPVGGEVKFGSLSIVVRSCKTRPVEETPDNFAFVDVADTTLQGEQVNIFKGWMISSSPATHAVEHPIFDVWLLKCYDTKIDKTALLDAEQLSARDTLKMIRDGKEVTPEEAVTEQETEANAPIAEMQAENEPQNDDAAQEMMSVEFIYDEENEENEDSETGGESGEDSEQTEEVEEQTEAIEQ